MHRAPRLALTLYLASASSAIAAAPVNISTDLLVVAKRGGGASIKARASAIDDLGLLGADALGSDAPEVVKELTEILKSESQLALSGTPEANFICLHVVNTLGQFGTQARPALAEMSQAVGRDATLTAAIDCAASKITKPATKTTAAAKPASDPTPPTLLGLRLDLTSANPDPAKQLEALKILQALKDAATPLLGDILPLMKSSKDADVRRMALIVAKGLIDTLADGPAKDEWTDIYVNGLADMLQPAHDIQERLSVIGALSVLRAECVKAKKLCPLVTATLTDAKNDKDPVVSGAAKAILEPPKPAPAAATKPADGKSDEDVP